MFTPELEKLDENLVAGGADHSEDGLTALLQVLKCEIEKGRGINWSDASFNMIFYISDATTKIIGDGIPARFIKKNDGQCHMKNNTVGEWTYTMAQEMDFPSIGQILNEIRERQAAVIFAVTPKNRPFYAGCKSLDPITWSRVPLLRVVPDRIK